MITSTLWAEPAWLQTLIHGDICRTQPLSMSTRTGVQGWGTGVRRLWTQTWNWARTCSVMAGQRGAGVRGGDGGPPGGVAPLSLALCSSHMGARDSTILMSGPAASRERLSSCTTCFVCVYFHVWVGRRSSDDIECPLTWKWAPLAGSKEAAWPGMIDLGQTQGPLSTCTKACRHARASETDCPQRICTGSAPGPGWSSRGIRTSCRLLELHALQSRWKGQETGAEQAPCWQLDAGTDLVSVQDVLHAAIHLQLAAALPLQEPAPQPRTSQPASRTRAVDPGPIPHSGLAWWRVKHPGPGEPLLSAPRWPPFVVSRCSRQNKTRQGSHQVQPVRVMRCPTWFQSGHVLHTLASSADEGCNWTNITLLHENSHGGDSHEDHWHLHPQGWQSCALNNTVQFPHGKATHGNLADQRRKLQWWPHAARLLCVRL